MKCPECREGDIRTLRTKSECPCCGNHPFVCDKCFSVFEAPHSRVISISSDDFYLEEIPWASEDFKRVAKMDGGEALSEAFSEFMTIESYFRNKNN